MSQSLVDVRSSHSHPSSNIIRLPNFRQPVPPSTAYGDEPGFCVESSLWLYGNVKALTQQLAYVGRSLGRPDQRPSELDQIEREAEELVLDGKILVCGIHNPAHQRVAIVPLRWGSPRIIAFSGGFQFHLGPELEDEPFPVARLWRYRWDRKTDLAVSRRAPDKLPTYARYNPTVDRMVQQIAEGRWPGLAAPLETFLPVLRAA